MLRSVIAGSSLIALLAFYEVSNAQVRNTAPYLGGSVSAGPGGLGWGIEAGLRFFPFYAGLEYGVYYLWPTSSSSSFPAFGSIPPPTAISSAQYGGIHAGYIMSDSLFVGIVVLLSSQIWDTPDSVEAVISRKTIWDFGVDLKSAVDKHLYLAFALTYRRGLKAGLGFMF
jgi:hypothetical protein